MLTIGKDAFTLGLIERVTQIRQLANGKFPIFSYENLPQSFLLSSKGSWVGGFWLAIHKQLQINSDKHAYTFTTQLPNVNALEGLQNLDTIHTAMVFWYGNRAVPEYLSHSAHHQAARYDNDLGFIPLGTDFSAGDDGKFTFSVDSLAAIIHLLSSVNVEKLDSIARKHVEFYCRHCVSQDGSCLATWKQKYKQVDKQGDWSRGQAWASLGLVTAAQTWPDQVFYELAEATLNYWVQSRGEALAPNKLSSQHGPYDPSANVIAALAMYQFSDLTQTKHWQRIANKLMDAVLDSDFLEQAPLVSSDTKLTDSDCVYRFRGCAIPYKNQTIVTETIWGIYFLLAALAYRFPHPEE